MRRFPVLLLSGVVLFYAQNVSAWEVTCPVFVETEPYTAVLKSFVQPQWRVSPRQEPRQWLTHIGVTQDKPENFGDQKPEMKKIKQETWLIWNTEGATAKESDRYWFSCIYSYGLVWLSQPVPVNTHSCKTLYFDEPPREKPVSLICE
ncbi:STY0301 family protein [Escherichia coli]